MIIINLVVTTFLILIETVCLPILIALPMRPDITLLFLVSVSMSQGKEGVSFTLSNTKACAFIYFLAGLLFDLFSNNPLGVHSLAYLAAGVVVFILSVLPVRWRYLIIPLTFLLSAAVYNSVLILLLSFRGVNFYFPKTSFILAVASVDFIVGTVFYPLLAWILRKTRF